MDSWGAAWLLPLLAALGWSAFDVQRKNLTRILEPIKLNALQSSLQVLVFAAGLLVFGEFLVTSGYWGPGLLLVGLNVSANLLFLVALQRGALSSLIPLLSLTPVLSLAGSAVALGEWPGGAVTLAAGMVFCGALLSQPGFRLTSHSGNLPMLGVAVLWALGPVVDKIALKDTNLFTHGLLQSVASAVVSVLIWKTRRANHSLQHSLGRSLPARVWGLLALATVTSACAVLAQYAAVQVQYVGIVEGIKRGIGIVSAAAIGVLFFSEVLTKSQLAGLLICLVGSVWMAVLG